MIILARALPSALPLFATEGSGSKLNLDMDKVIMMMMVVMIMTMMDVIFMMLMTIAINDDDDDNGGYIVFVLFSLFVGKYHRRFLSHKPHIYGHDGHNDK